MIWSDQCIAVRRAVRSHKQPQYYVSNQLFKKVSGQIFGTNERGNSPNSKVALVRFKINHVWLQQLNHPKNRSQTVSMLSKTHNPGNSVHSHSAECGATDECFRICTRCFYSPMWCTWSQKSINPDNTPGMQIWTFFVLILFNASAFTTI